MSGGRVKFGSFAHGPAEGSHAPSTLSCESSCPLTGVLLRLLLELVPLPLLLFRLVLVLVLVLLLLLLPLELVPLLVLVLVLVLLIMLLFLQTPSGRPRPAWRCAARRPPRAPSSCAG